MLYDIIGGIEVFLKDRTYTFQDDNTSMPAEVTLDSRGIFCVKPFVAKWTDLELFVLATLIDRKVSKIL